MSPLTAGKDGQLRLHPVALVLNVQPQTVSRGELSLRVSLEWWYPNSEKFMDNHHLP